MNKRKSLLLITLIIVFFASMYALLSIASRKALLDFGAILGKSNYRMLINNIIIGVILAVIPYELIYARISGWFSELVEEKDAEKLHIWASVILIIINIILSVFACVVRHNSPFYMGSTNRKFQYVMLLFICLCIGIIISCRKIGNRPVRCIIRSFATALNAFLMIYITRNMAHAIIIVLSMTVFILLYDGIICKRLNWKEVVATVLVGTAGTVAGILAKEYHYLVEPDSLGKMLVSIEKVDLYLGFGCFILFIAIAVSMVMILGFSSKSMAKNSPVRGGFLMGAASLFACSFVYTFLSIYDILPYVETQFITSRGFVIGFVWIVRCFIIIPVPEKEEKPSFIDRVLNSKSEDDEDDDFD